MSGKIDGFFILFAELNQLMFNNNKCHRFITKNSFIFLVKSKLFKKLNRNRWILAIFFNKMAGRRGLSTLNVEELKKFEAIAAEWWSLNGPAKGLHSMNGVRVPFVCDNLLKAQGKSVSDDLPLKNTKIIDIGCGGGILSEALARLGASVVGLDPCEANIKAAKLHASDTGSLSDRLVYLPMTAEDYLSQHDENEPFDAVVASEVIEHVDNPKEFVNVCSKFVPVGGSLFFTTINRTTKSWLGAIIGNLIIILILYIFCFHYFEFPALLMGHTQ